MQLIVGVSGASGDIYGIRLLETLRQTDVASHLILTPAARKTVHLETNHTAKAVEALATQAYARDSEIRDS